MCLKFDPKINELKQTRSGKCKNKCGFVLDGDKDSSLKTVHTVHIEARNLTSVKLNDTPFLIQNSSINRTISLSNSIKSV